MVGSPRLQQRKADAVSLVLYDSMRRQKVPFEPIDPQSVRLYVCGPTVYDFAHIGNARPVIVFDLLFRVLRHLYGESHVRYVRNITDIDDKIIAAAAANGESIRALTERTNTVYDADMVALGNLLPTIRPRATEHIPSMIRMIAQLIARGHAYEAAAHVLFAIGSMPDYGRLSGRSMEDMRAGARVEIAPFKRDPGDFVLWKPSDSTQPGWDSPWGRGRPGWHIECSAMSEAHLGAHFDIHGGGLDLIFPHHENERAQSLCAHDGEPFVNIWMHNALLDVEGAKMSKSRGNILRIGDLLAEYPGEVLRYAMLSAHYRDPLDWTTLRTDQARASLNSLYGALRGVGDLPPIWPEEPAVMPALSDDLNTPQAQATLHELAGQLNKATTDTQKAAAKGALLAAGHIMGVLTEAPEAWFRWRARSVGGFDDAEIDRLVGLRHTARRTRDFAESDRIRDLLTEAGVTLEDSAQGTSWRRQ
jgi:cysteinyl-tRNA synthetase